MFDILVFLFESYFYTGAYPDSNKLSRKLVAAGFEDDEIDEAIDWLSGLQQLDSANYPASILSLSPRCYAELEVRRISTEGLHFLSFWEHSQTITPIEREMILDRALALGYDAVPLDKIKLIALMVLWKQHEEIDPLLVEDLLMLTDSNQPN
jgi:Smg protein